jgi:hypothetical protein
MKFVRSNSSGAASSRSPRQNTLVSASGIRLIVRRKGVSRITVSVLDRDGLLLVKANFNLQDWKDFVKAQ